LLLPCRFDAVATPLLLCNPVAPSAGCSGACAGSMPSSHPPEFVLCCAALRCAALCCAPSICFSQSAVFRPHPVSSPLCSAVSAVSSVRRPTQQARSSCTFHACMQCTPSALRRGCVSIPKSALCARWTFVEKEQTGRSYGAVCHSVCLQYSATARHYPSCSSMCRVLCALQALLPGFSIQGPCNGTSLPRHCLAAHDSCYRAHTGSHPLLGHTPAQAVCAGCVRHLA
jgi:hypothetical protein